MICKASGMKGVTGKSGQWHAPAGHLLDVAPEVVKELKQRGIEYKEYTYDGRSFTRHRT